MTFVYVSSTARRHSLTMGGRGGLTGWARGFGVRELGVHILALPDSQDEHKQVSVSLGASVLLSVKWG